MADLSQMIVRVVHKYEGRDAMRQARKDVKGVKDGSDELNASLVAASGAFAAFAASAVSSFGEIETAMAKFASRAGWTLKRFRRETEASIHETARLTGTTQTLLAQATQEGISQGFLGGMKTSDVLRLQRQSSKLHAAGQTNLLQAMRAGIVARQYGAPSADRGLEWIYAASQVGAGNPSDYANAFMDVAPGGSLLDIPITESLGALALVATGAPSLEEGATWISALYKTISMPMQDAQRMMKERLGLDWKTDIPAMVKEVGGLERFLRMVRDNFTGPEIFEMFGRQEAVKGLEVLTLIPGQLTALQQQVRERGEGSPIDRAWADNVATWGVNVERLGRSIDAFMRSWGEPLAFVANRVVDLLRWLIDSLTNLNNILGGVPSILAALVGALITVAGSIDLFRTAVGWMRNFQGLLGGGVGGGAAGVDVENEGRRNRRNRNWNTAVEAGATLAGAGGAAWWAGRRLSELAPSVQEEVMDAASAANAWYKWSQGDKSGWFEALKGTSDWPGRDMSNMDKAKSWFGSLINLFMESGPRGSFRRSRSGQGGRDRFAPYPAASGGPGGWADIFGASLGFMYDKADAGIRRGRGSGLGMMWGMAGGATNFTLSAIRKHWIIATTAAFIGGFQWWYRKTAQMTGIQGIYARAGLRPGVRGHIAAGGDLADAPEMTVVDMMQMQAERVRALTKIAEERTGKRIRELLSMEAAQGNWIHQFLASRLKIQQESIFEEDRQLAIAQANRRRLLNKLLGVEDEAFDKHVDEMNAQNNWWRTFFQQSWVNKLFGGALFGTPEPESLAFQSISMSQDWLKTHGKSANIPNMSEGIAQHILNQIDGHQLPRFDPRDNPNYDARALLQQRLSQNPGATFTININVENMENTTPEEVGKAVEKGAAAMWQRWGQVDWNSVTDDQDSAIY